MKLALPLLILCLTTILGRMDGQTDVADFPVQQKHQMAHEATGKVDDVTMEVTTDPVAGRMNGESDVTSLDDVTTKIATNQTLDLSRGSQIQDGTSKRIRDNGIPIVVAIGVPCNAWAFILMQRKSLRSVSNSVYFSALAIADSWVLLHMLSNEWSKSYFGTSIWIHHSIPCALNQWALKFGITWAAWIMVALTAERLLVVLFPLHVQSKSWCTRRKATITVVIITITWATVWAVLIFMQGDEATPKCHIPKLQAFQKRFGYWIVIGTYSFGPSSLLVILNGVLVYHLQKSLRSRRMMVVQGLKNGDVTANVMVNAKTTSSTTRATVMACVVSCTYVLLTTPACIFRLCERVGLRNDTDFVVASQALLILRISNHAINFFLYLMTSDKTRAEFVAMVTCNRRQRTDSRKAVGGISTSDSSTPDVSK